MLFSNTATKIPCDVVINDSVKKTDCTKLPGLFIDLEGQLLLFYLLICVWVVVNHKTLTGHSR